MSFRVEPEDAEVFLEAGTDKAYSLGLCNQKIALDLALFDGRREVKLTFRREGYLDETRSLQSPPVQFRYFDSQDVYPPPSEGAVRLEPKSDLASRVIQIRRFVSTYSLALASLGILGIGGIGFALKRWRQLKLEQSENRRFKELTASLDSSDPFSGKSLGRYRILERIGTGGMSLVYRAVPDDLASEGEAEVAIKVLDPKLAVSSDASKRFRREIAICAELRHPHILPIYEYGEQHSVLYLVMELLQGKTLSEHGRGRPVEPSQILDWLDPIVEAVAYLHSRGIVHRDLKPDNIFRTEAGKIKIMDFGIARGEEFTVATATHQGLGTPAYMSPEQVEGTFCEASDQYSLGCMVYEWLTGSTPFVDPDPFALAFKHVGQKPRSLREYDSRISTQLDSVVLRMLAKAPEERFDSIKEAGAHLKEALKAPYQR